MRLRILLLPAVALALLGSGCSAFSEDGADAGDGIQVAAAFYPLEYVVERVAGDLVEVTQLTRPGGEPHDLELTVRQVGLVTEADLVVYEKDFQASVDEAVDQNATGETVDAASVVDLLPYEDSAGGHEHGEEGHDHEEEHDHGEEGHDHGDHDPHFWQDPLRVADLGDAVAKALGAIDPDHQDDYAANADDLRGDLETLDAAYSDGLQDCERDTVVVSHDAFSYLEKYGVRIASIVGLSPDATPTSAVIGRLQDLIRSEGITTVFSEPLEPALGDDLADDLDLTNGSLDPIEGLTDRTADQDYLSLMEANLAALRKANGCG